MDGVIGLIVSMMRRKLWFVAIVCGCFLAVLLWQDGFSAANIAIGAAMIVILGLFAALVWFWTTVLQSWRSKER